MAGLGWFSGDTHNHREPADLPNVMLAEDVNVGLPLTDWTTVSTISPAAAERSMGGKLSNGVVRIDATHAWQPRNTEYEIFRTGNANHTLGAVFILNHQTRFTQTVFPLRDIADKARAEGALLDLDKHNWNWSLALIPLLKVDLFELGNNHHWRANFSITNWAVPAPQWMKLGSGTDTERNWTLYGFQTYYALLNSGFRMRPAAGTANGVHPVPLGFSRVYVHLAEPFSFEAWMRGLNAGRSFITTGPMIFAKVDGQWPGKTFEAGERFKDFQIECNVRSEQALENIELIVNGVVKERFAPANQKTDAGSFESRISTRFHPESTAWLALRCFEKRPDGRLRFAHTAPWYLEVPGKPLRPLRDEADWLVARVKEEIARSEKIAPQTLIDEYRAALAIYEQIAATAR
jgi:hypothetical protein